MAGRPTGAVTFLFTDVEGSTQAWEKDPAGMASALEIHDQVLRTTIEAHRGFVFATGGDSFSVAFSSPAAALTAAVETQRGLVESRCGLRVRMGVHSGEALERDGNYFGPPLNRTARLMSIGHGGQVLVSEITRGLVSASDFEFVDLGEHRLADLSAPTRISQLVADGLETAFAPLKSVVAADNLPALGEIFGRSTDIARLSELLIEQRLVTLTGAGGIGKTTLATAVAAGMIEHFPDGRWLVDLTELPTGSDRSAIAGAVAGADERFGSIATLERRRMLMILDNCEHVLDGVRRYLGDLLAAAPDVTVLATSREPLGIRGEKAVPVAPLSVDENSEHASAVDLFVERAEESGESLDLASERETITAICREVGGLPLAIELAAARTAVMTPAQILDRLGDRLSILKGGTGGPHHHRTIEATIAWSYDLLDEETRKLLRFLSVFEGGFDLEQAEAVGGDRAVDQLTDLVRKSLVTRDSNRFGMLEAVRQYGVTRLQAAGEEDDARRLHFEFFAGWAHSIYSRDEFIRATVDELHGMTANLANLHAAVRWGAGHGSPIGAAEITETLWVHMVTVLYGRPQPNWYEPLLAHLDDLPAQLQLGVLHGAAVIQDWILGNPDRALALMEAEYEIHARTGLLPRSGANPQNGLGMLALRQGRWDEAIRWFREGAEVGPFGLIAAANFAGTMWGTFRATPEEALAVIEKARNDAEETQPGPLANLDLLEAGLRIQTGEVDRARQMILRSLGRLREANIRYDLQYTSLSLLSVIERSEGHIDASATLLLEAIDLAVGHGLDPIWRNPSEVIDLATTLVALGHALLASDLVASFWQSYSYAKTPWEVDEFGRLEQRIEQADQLSTTEDRDEAHPSLLDAIRRVLEEATR